MNSELTPLRGEAHPFRRVDAGQGVVWLQKGWGFFIRNPGAWIAIALLLMVMMGLMFLVPFLGQMAANLTAPLFAAGLLLGCRSLDNGAGINVDHLFIGFRQSSGNLVMVGLLFMVGQLAAFFIALFVGGGLATGSGLLGLISGQVSLAAVGVVAGLSLMVLIFALLSIPLCMAFWFAPALVVFQDAQPMPAMIASFRASLKNTLPFFIYGVIAMILFMLAAIPMGLGFLVLIPVLIASSYWSYVDIFE